MEEKELKKEIMTIDQQTKLIIVKDQKSFTLAGEITIGLDAMIKKVQIYWKEPKEKAFQAHKAITAKENEMLAPLKQMRYLIQQKISQYLTEQERKRREEQARLDEQRRKQEEAERKRLEERATRAEEKGKIEKAEALREKVEAVYIPPAFVQSEIEKTTHLDSGTISQKKNIKVTIIDPLQIIQAIAKGQAPITIIEIKEAKLKSFLEIQGLKEFPGCEIREVIGIQVRNKMSA